MLPAAARLRESRDFAAVVRGGRKTGTRSLVLYLRCGEPEGDARVGFIVSKAVGNSVVRHRVARRLRHVVRDRLDLLPRGSMVAVRALPRAADATSAELARDVDRALRRVGVAGGAGSPEVAEQE